MENSKELNPLSEETSPHLGPKWPTYGGTVVSTAGSQLQGPGFDSWLGSLSVWSLHVLPVSVWVSSGCSGFLPQSKDVRVGHAKLPLSVLGCVG